MDTTFVADLSAAASPFPHFWEHTIGSGHARLALQADWRRQLLRTTGSWVSNTYASTASFPMTWEPWSMRTNS